MSKKKDAAEPVLSADDREEQLAALFKHAAKNYGKGMVAFARDFRYKDVSRVSTGILALDYTLGGGLPIGRISMFYGPKSCLAEDTFIGYQIRTADGQKQNGKGGTIKRLYERFNGIEVGGKGYYNRPETDGSYFHIPSVDDDGRIFHNRVVNVVESGVKECFRLTVSTGETISATADHKFFTGTGFVRLGDIRVGDIVTVSRRTKPDADKATYSSRKYISVKHHPYACKHTVTPVNERTKNVRSYTYHRLIRSRAVVEAYMNKCSLPEYLDRLNSGDLDGLVFLRTDQHVHHIDENHLNDSLSNLAIIDSVSHGVLHAKERKLGCGYAHEVEVVSIESEGLKPTYDIEMLAPYNNFVADSFIVHNSSKTTAFLRAAGRAQRMCSNCWTPAFPIWTPDHGASTPSCSCGNYRKTQVAWLDAEGVWDHQWSSRFLDVESLVLSQPETGEQTCDIADAMLRSGAVDVIVIDSVAFMIPVAEMEKSASEATVGEQARLLGKMFRKLVAGTNALASRDGRRPTVWFTNQIRMKVGVMFGNPETVPGGYAQGFATSTETRMSPGKYAKDDTGRTSSVIMKIRNEKNKCGPAKMEGEYILVLKDTEYKKVGQIADETYAAKLGEQAGLVQVGRGKQPTIADGFEYESKAHLIEHWITNPQDYEDFKFRLVQTLLSDVYDYEATL